MRVKALISRILTLTLSITLAALATHVLAQGLIVDPDWKELEVPAPPAFSKDKLIPVTMPPYVTLKFGVDPATLAIGNDGIVRYVMVTTSTSGSVSAMYEGLRCSAGEFKTYARFSSSGQWVAVKDPQWRGLNDNNVSKHAMALARQGACVGRAMAASSVPEIIWALKSPPFNPALQN